MANTTTPAVPPWMAAAQQAGSTPAAQSSSGGFGSLVLASLIATGVVAWVLHQKKEEAREEARGELLARLLAAQEEQPAAPAPMPFYMPPPYGGFPVRWGR